MASRGNITGIHFALVIFAMLSVVFIALSWVKISNEAELKAAVKQAKDDRKDLDRKWNDSQDKLDMLKKTIGVKGDVLLDDQSKANAITVLKKLMDKWNGTEGTRQDKLVEVVEVVYKKLLDSDKDLKDTVALHNKEKTIRENKRKEFQAKLDNSDKALKAERDAHLRTIKQFDERVRPKDEKIAELTRLLQQREADIDNLRTKTDQEKQNLNQRIVKLSTALQRKERILANLDQQSFEIPDGEILTVNYQLGLVWINLGSADNLPERGTFSIYAKSNNGIGRGEKIDPNNPDKTVYWKHGPKDIKGAIEITRILGPHRAEARIVPDKGDDNKPFAAGDLLYSPAYTPGQINSFAFAGLFDFNDDGISDAESLKADVIRSGGRVSVFVGENITNKYAKKRPAVSIQDKFLVRGLIPDLTESPVDKREAHKLMIQEYGKMIQEAKDNGVRIISMNDFLAYMGINPTKRLHRPGEGEIRPLANGSKSSKIGGKISRTASATVSGVYTGKRKRLKQNQSTGQVSGRYKSGGK